jgi:hypothetical protein
MAAATASQAGAFRDRNNNFRAVLGEPEGDRLANSTGGAGHNRDFSGEVEQCHNASLRFKAG